MDKADGASSEIQVISDDEGIAVLGDGELVDRFIDAVGLPVTRISTTAVGTQLTNTRDSCSSDRCTIAAGWSSVHGSTRLLSIASRRVTASVRAGAKRRTRGCTGRLCARCEDEIRRSATLICGAMRSMTENHSACIR